MNEETEAKFISLTSDWRQIFKGPSVALFLVHHPTVILAAFLRKY